MAAPAPPAFGHVDPKTNTATMFSYADCENIAAAQRDGRPSVRISDVRLPSGRVLRFEVRFGVNAVSSRSPAPSHTGMLQVNLDDGNSRTVVRA